MLLYLPEWLEQKEQQSLVAQVTPVFQEYLNFQSLDIGHI